MFTKLSLKLGTFQGKTMKFSVGERNVSQMFKIIFSISAIMGVFPLSPKNAYVEFSKPLIIWSTIVCLYISCYDAYVISYIIAHHDIKFILLNIAQELSFNFAVVLAPFWFCIKRKQIGRIISSIRIIESMVYPLKLKINILEYLCTVVLMFCMFIFECQIEDDAQLPIRNITLIYYYYEAIIIFSIAFQFSRTLLFIDSAFDQITDKLHTVKENSVINLLINCYDSLTGTIEKINEAYGPQILLITTSCFALALGQFYEIVAEFRFELSDIVRTWWVFIFVKVCWNLIAAADFTSSKAAEFNKILYRISLEDNTGQIARNPKVLLHFSNRRTVSFTACGFFTIDFTLASSMIAAGTTYLVILFQMGTNK